MEYVYVERSEMTDFHDRLSDKLSKCRLTYGQTIRLPSMSQVLFHMHPSIIKGHSTSALLVLSVPLQLHKVLTLTLKTNVYPNVCHFAIQARVVNYHNLLYE